MLKQLPVKKEYLLIAATIILLWMCYQLAFKKTITAWQINHRLNIQLTHATGLNYQPAYLERKKTNLSKILEQYKTDTATFRSNTISAIASIAEKEQVKLSGVPLQDPMYHTSQFIIQKLVFEGSFFALTKTLDRLQKTNGIGRVRSVTFKLTGESPDNNTTKKLTMEVYLVTVK